LEKKQSGFSFDGTVLDTETNNVYDSIFNRENLFENSRIDNLTRVSKSTHIGEYTANQDLEKVYGNLPTIQSKRTSSILEKGPLS